MSSEIPAFDPASAGSGLSRPAARAAVLDNVTRAFLTDAGRDSRAHATFADIGAALIPLVDRAGAVSIARLLAGQSDIPAAVLAALAARGLKPRGARAPEPPARVPAEPSEATPAPQGFLPHDESERRRVIAEAARFAALDSAPEARRRPEPVATLALARAADRGDREDALKILAAILQSKLSALQPVLEDSSGRSMALALRAAGFERHDAIRVLVGVGPAATRARVTLRAVMAEFDQIERAVAVRLLAAATRAAWGARDDAASMSPTRRLVASGATISPSSGWQTGPSSHASPQPLRASGRDRP